MLQALGGPRQFDCVADRAANLHAASFVYRRAASHKGCKVSGATLQKGTLLRLLLPLNDQVWTTFQLWVVVADLPEPVRKPHLAIQSVVATGGVYKGQGRSRHELMTRAY